MLQQLLRNADSKLMPVAVLGSLNEFDSFTKKAPLFSYVETNSSIKVRRGLVSVRWFQFFQSKSNIYILN